MRRWANVASVQRLLTLSAPASKGACPVHGHQRLTSAVTDARGGAFQALHHSFGCLTQTRSLSIWGFGKAADAPVPWPTQAPEEAAAAGPPPAPLGTTDRGALVSDAPGTAGPFQPLASGSSEAPGMWAVDSSPADSAANVAADALAAGLDASALTAAHAQVWPATSLAMSGLALGHDMYGLPWWASIAVFSVGMRLLILAPLKYTMELHQRRRPPDKAVIVVKRRLHGKEFTGFKLTKEYAAMSPAARDEHADNVAATRKAYPGANMGTLRPEAHLLNLMHAITGFAWITMLSGASALVAAQVPSMSAGGTLWFTDLTVPDSTLGLTLLTVGMLFTAASTRTFVSLNADPSPQDLDNIATADRIFKLFALTVITVPIGFYLSAGTMLLGFCDRSLAIVQNRVVRAIVDHQVVVATVPGSVSARARPGAGKDGPGSPPPGGAPPPPPSPSPLQTSPPPASKVTRLPPGPLLKQVPPKRGGRRA